MCLGAEDAGSFNVRGTMHTVGFGPENKAAVCLFTNGVQGCRKALHVKLLTTP